MYGPISALYHKTGLIQKKDLADLAGRVCFAFILFADVLTSMVGESLYKSAAEEWKITSPVCTCIVWVYSVWHIGYYIYHCTSDGYAEYERINK